MARIAVLYERAFNAGEKVTRWIADYLNEPSHTLITQRVAKARKRSFLTEAPAKGKAGGQATEKAHGVLRKAKEDHEATMVTRQ